MKREDFVPGVTEFQCVGKVWRCTDVGTRTVVAIRIDKVMTGREMLEREQAEARGWFKGPPYAVQELVFDEHDLKVCYPYIKLEDHRV